MPLATQQFDAVWVATSAGVWATSRTVESATPGGTSWGGLIAGSILYIGDTQRFDLFRVIVATAGSTSAALTYEYSSAIGPPIVWSRYYPRWAYTWSTTGVEQWGQLVSWVSAPFSATDPIANAPPDTTSRYWIRISGFSGVASENSPLINQIIKRRYAHYAIPTDVSRLLQVAAFSSTTTPALETVEDYIHRAQDRIDYTAKKSWRLNYIQNEHHAFNIGGFRLLHKDIDTVDTLDIWDGSAFDTKTQGRTSDYFVIPELGMVYFSRFFLLPARIAGYGSLWATEGEFSNPVRVSYVYGRDIDRDPQAYMIQDICAKIAAIDVFRNHDRSVLVVSGADNIALREKVESWKLEVEDGLESLKSWEVF